MSETKELRVIVRVKVNDELHQEGVCAYPGFDLTPVLDDMEIFEVQELLDEDAMISCVHDELFDEDKVSVSDVEVLGFTADSCAGSLKAYLLKRIRLKVQGVMDRAEEAINAFMSAGGEIYNGSLSVNVKCYESMGVPELKEEVMEQLEEWERDDFWRFDMADECHNSDGYFGEHKFPEVYGEGRGGGHLTFRDTNTAADTLKEYTREGTWSGHHTTEAGDILSCIEAWENVEADNPEEDADTLWDAYNGLADFFESATKWVEFVKACMRYRIDNLQGKSLDWLRCHVDNERFELFDFDDCDIEMRSGLAIVSWPQHKRKFKDAGQWEECSADDEGAHEYNKAEPVRDVGEECTQQSFTKAWQRWVPAPLAFFSLELTKTQLAEILEPKFAEVRLALCSVGKE